MNLLIPYLRGQTWNNVLFISLLTLFAHPFVAQSTQDTVKEKRVKFLFGLDANTSFVLKNKSKFNGIRIGIQVDGVHKMGYGVYSMRTPLITKRKLSAESYPNNDGELSFNYSYRTIFYEYIWYKTKRWELSDPLHIGFGQVNVTYNDTIAKKSKPFFKGNSGVIQFSFATQYKITRWLAFGSGIGYRFAIAKNKKVVEGLSAPLYVFRMKILMGELLKMWFKKDYKNKEWDKD